MKLKYNGSCGEKHNQRAITRNTSELGLLFHPVKGRSPNAVLTHESWE